MLSEHEEESSSSNRESKHRPLRRWSVVLAILVLLVGGAVYLADRQDYDFRGALRLAESASKEAATTASVKAALALSRKVSAFDIDVATQGSTVRLRGEVPSEEVRQLAVAIAEDTMGVERVEDQLIVDAAARPSPELVRLRKRVADLEIETALTRVLLGHPDLAERNLQAVVEDRRVTLTGTVRNAAERYGVEQVVAAVDGVREVVNQLEVENASPAADPKEHLLAKRTEFALYASDAFNMDGIEVRASDGSVILRGNVRSQAERLLAQRIAADVEGVDEVANELEVLTIPYDAGLVPSGETWTDPSS